MDDESIKPSLKDVRGEKSDTGESLMRGLRTEPTVSRETVQKDEQGDWQKAEQETTKVRQELDSIKYRDEINGTNQPSSITVKAEQRLAKFRASTELFNKQRAELIGPPKPVTALTHVADALKPLQNFARIPKDILERLASMDRAEDLRERTVEAMVLQRDALLTEPGLRQLFEVTGNRKILRNLMEQEVYKEVNAERLLMIKGLSKPEFQALVKRMGYNPWAFLSDGRKENAGRVAIDNEWPLGGKHPLGLSPNDPDYERDKALYQKVFPRVKRIPWVKDWRMSRTHGIVYCVKDTEGKDVMLFPVHMDTKNPIVFVKNLVDKVRGRKPEKDDRDAMEYHQAAKEADASYVGTGLYDLGIKNFLRLLQQTKDQGKIANLVSHGESTLDTTGSIIKDDRVTWAIKGKS